MRRSVSILSLALLPVLSAATVAAQQPAAPAATTYTAQFDVQGNAYVGTTTFMVDKAGKVSGTMKLTDPATVNAKLGGELANGVWKFSYPFTMDNQGQACDGMLTGTAKATADLAELAGEVNITGNCAADAMSGTFKFTKNKK